jgi:2-dehydro-3-deoxygluconokinase
MRRPRGLDVLCAGEALWDLGTVGGQTFAGASRLSLSPGGAAVNAAAALAARGLSVGLAATVGADALGRALVARVGALGVDTRFVEEAPARTGLVFLEQADEAARVVAYRGDDEPPPRVPADARARVLLLTGIGASPAQLDAFEALAAGFAREGSIVVVDLNARLRLWRGREASGVKRALASAHMIKASAADLAAMGLGEDEMRSWRPRGALLVITDGPSPVRAFGSFGEIVIPCPPVRAKRPIGAGDAFTASVIASLVERSEADLHEHEWTQVLIAAVGAARDHVRARPRPSVPRP